MENKKILYRVNEGKKISGVCKGISDYTDIDVITVRLLYVIASLFSGIPIIIYIILSFVLPVKELGFNKNNVQEDEYAYDPEDYKL